MARKILVYDEPNLESPAGLLLENGGYGVLPARSGAAGLDQVEQLLSDLALINASTAKFAST